LADLPSKRPVASIAADVVRARFAAEMGRFDEARTMLDDAMRIGAESMPGAVRVRRSTALAAAWVERAAGNPGAARARLATASFAPWDGQGRDYTLLAARDCLAAIDVDEGHPKAALAYFESAASLLGDSGSNVRGRRDEAIVRIAFGRALLAEHRAAEAKIQFERAATLLANQHALSPLRALARNWQGVAAFDLGNVREAQAALKDVRRVYAQLPALNHECRAAEQELIALVEATVHRGPAVAKGG
jgi:tetratricopeptide (TPR) repeat protein